MEGLAHRPHQLADVLRDAAIGRFPSADGRWRRIPVWRPGIGAVVAFTGHAFVAVDDVPDTVLDSLGIDGFGGAHHPRVITALAGESGWIDSLDVLMIGVPGEAGPSCRLVERPDLRDHPRASHAAALRGDVRVLGYPDDGRRALACVGNGIGGLPELSFELEPDRRGERGATQLIEDALGCVAGCDLVVSVVAPGNAASLRALLAAGFTPVGSIQLFGRHRPGRRRI